METHALLGLAASVSLLSGWRVYLCVFATGLAMRLGLVAAPSQVPDLGVLASWWVMGIAALGFTAEFFVDKVMWADTLWDAVHTAVRPVGGAMLALAIVDVHDPVWQVVTLLAGGGAALASHTVKAGTRAVVNTSPEPLSNVAVSGAEDVATGGLLIAAFANPVLAGAVALAMVVALVWLGLRVAGLARTLFGRRAR